MKKKPRGAMKLNKRGEYVYRIELNDPVDFAVVDANLALIEQGIKRLRQEVKKQKPKRIKRRAGV